MITVPPCARLSNSGPIFIRKEGGVTNRNTFCMTVSAPDVADTLTVVCESGAESSPMNVRRLFADDGFGFKTAVTPEGSGEVMARLGVPVNPTKSAMFRVVELA
jgi:hypothetical protein